MTNKDAPLALPPQTLTPDMAKAIMEFMSRTDLNAREIQAWSSCMAFLDSVANPKPPIHED